MMMRDSELTMHSKNASAFADAVLGMGWMLINPLTRDVFVQVGPAHLWPGDLSLVEDDWNVKGS